MMVLFGGGDGGGFWIGPDGKIHRIPPWNPELLRQLRAAKAVLSAADGLGEKGLGRELLGIGERLTTTAIPEVVKVAGQAGAEEGPVVFMDAEDGFVCGSTGKRPIPFPVPHGPPSVSETHAFAER
jgi:hypothetical protein